LWLLDALVRLRLRLRRLAAELRHLLGLPRHRFRRRRALDLIRLNSNFTFRRGSRLPLSRRFGFALLLLQLFHLRLGHLSLDRTQEVLLLIWLRFKLNGIVIRFD
jgi:hypothetical protein